jgi:hypothetical protein
MLDLVIAVLVVAIVSAGILVPQNVVGLFILTYGFPIIALGFYLLWAIWPPVDRAGRPTQFRARLLAMILLLVAWNWVQVLVLGRRPLPHRPWRDPAAWAQVLVYALPMLLMIWLFALEAARGTRWLIRRTSTRGGSIERRR